MDARIQAVMDFVSTGSRVVDVGADHGYLSVALIESGRAAKVIATEKNLHPFEALSKNIRGLERCEARLGDGLRVLTEGEVDTICIAGMGGALICKILDDSPEVVHSVRRLILQPMNGAKKIRTWLAENGWIIVDEDLAESAGIIYEILCAERNASSKIFKRDSSPLLEKFFTQRAEKIQHVLAEMSNSVDASHSDKFAALQAEAADLVAKAHSCHSNSIAPI